MTSKAAATNRPTPRKLPFFPASLPGETLLSRVTRYHLLTAERKDEVTLLALFGQPGNKVDFTALAPPSLSVLASLLPGDPLVQLGKILGENTFVPFAVPIIASSIEEFPVSEFGEGRSCLVCLEEDEVLVGAPDLHRSHQLPAVNACWKHGTKLIDTCPECACPFRRPAGLLRAPIVPCSCGWHALGRGSTARRAFAAEHEFAIHANDALVARTRQAQLAVLVRFFLTQIEHIPYH
jgi:hypothetical protein